MEHENETDKREKEWERSERERKKEIWRLVLQNVCHVNVTPD